MTDQIKNTERLGVSKDFPVLKNVIFLQQKYNAFFNTAKSINTLDSFENLPRLRNPSKRKGIIQFVKKKLNQKQQEHEKSLAIVYDKYFDIQPTFTFTFQECFYIFY